MNSLPAGWTKNRMKYCVTLNPAFLDKCPNLKMPEA